MDSTIVSSDSRGGPSPVEPSLGTREADGAALDGDAVGEADGVAEGVSDGAGAHATPVKAMVTTTPSHERGMAGC